MFNQKNELYSNICCTSMLCLVFKTFLLSSLDMIGQIFQLYSSPTPLQQASGILPAEIDPREVFMRAALK